WPLCCNCFRISPSPPLITLPAAPPASSPPRLPFRMSPSPPPLVAPPAGEGAGAAPGWPAVRCLTAFQASRPRIAMVIGDIPLDCALGLLGPRGPFCMPLRTSSKPMVLSCRWPGPAARNILAARDGYKARAARQGPQNSANKTQGILNGMRNECEQTDRRGGRRQHRLLCRRYARRVGAQG